ncbi:MAG: phage tail tape measure protein [Clostridium sp.]|nr:phage tail tape measure protein [Clostridium sp.]
MGTTSKTSEALEILGVSAYDSEGNFRGVETTLKDVKTAMAGMSQEQQDMLSAALGGKTQIDTLKALLDGLGKEYDGLKADIGGADGALEEMYQTMTDTTAGNIEELKGKMESLGIALSKNLLPHLNNLIDKIVEVIEWFGGLDESTQSFIINTGLITFATGGALKAFGSLTTGVGSVVKGLGNLIVKFTSTSTAASLFSTSATVAAGGTTTLAAGFGAVASAAAPVAIAVAAVGTALYAAHEYNDLYSSGIEKSTDEMSLMEIGLGKLTGAVMYSRDELEEMGLVYEDFNENISDSFKKTVEDMTTDIHDFGMTLSEMTFDGVFSEEESNSLAERVSGALDSCLNAIDSKNNEFQSGLRKAFGIDGVIDESEQSLLEYWSSVGSKEKEEAQKLEDEITKIRNTARAEGRDLTPEEISAIENYYAQIRQIELEAQASNSYEIEYAHKEFQNRINTLDAEGSKELLEQRYNNYQEQQVATKTNYDTLIAMAKEGYESLSEEGKRHADETVARLTEAKEEELALNQEKYDADIQYAEEHCQNLEMVWNKYRGEEVARKDLAYYEDYEQMRSHYQDIEAITESGYQKVYDTATGTWKDLYVSIDATTGELKGVYDMNTGNAIAMTKADASALQDERVAWQDTAQGILANCITMGTAYADTSGKIKNESGQIIGKITQVKDANGNLKNSIVDVNGHPLNIRENTASVISKLRDAARNADALNGKKSTITITTNHIDNYIQKYNSQGPGATKYASGGTVTEDTIAYTNEKAIGFELIEGNAVELASDNVGSITAMSAGTRVYSNTASVAMMKEEIAEQLSKIDFGEYYNRNTKASKQLNGNYMRSQNTIDGEKLGNVIANAVLKALGGISLNANVNVDSYGRTSNQLAMERKRVR